jgi:hypothetical protein
VTFTGVGTRSMSVACGSNAVISSSVSSRHALGHFSATITSSSPGAMAS